MSQKKETPINSKKEEFRVRVPDDLRAKINDFCVTENATKSAVIRSALTRYLTKLKKSG